LASRLDLERALGNRPDLSFSKRDRGLFFLLNFGAKRSGQQPVVELRSGKRNALARSEAADSRPTPDIDAHSEVAEAYSS
jgi:hypothetical protein